LTQEANPSAVRPSSQGSSYCERGTEGKPVPVLHHYDMAPGVTAFSTTRHGGVSKGSHGCLNLNAYCGDIPANVEENRRLTAGVLNIAADRLIMPHQVHLTVCRAITRQFLDASTVERQRLLEGVDAVMTDLRDICIGVSTADCIPVLLYDAAHHAAAAIHAGWRGTVARIVRRTVEQMAVTYGTRPEDLRAVIGPGISLKNFEVGQEVYDSFQSAGFDMEQIARRYAKWHIDLPRCNAMQLEESGVSPKNVFRSGICTWDSVADYFSARRLGQDSGRIFTAVIIHSQTDLYKRGYICPAGLK
jgi:YfiH family protein